MVSPALCVPYPKDDAETLDGALSTLIGVAADLAGKRTALARAGGEAASGWSGAAAGSFASSQVTGQARLGALAKAHSELHRQMASYHEGIVSARGSSRQAKSDIATALATYAGAAQDAVSTLLGGLEHVIGKLGDLIEQGLKAVVGLVEHGIDALTGHRDQAQACHDTLSSWAMPAVAPELRVTPVGAALDTVPTQASGVTSLLGGIEGFLVSRFTDGIDQLFAWGEGLLEGGLRMVDDAEKAVADKIAAAQRLAQSGLDDLLSLGGRIERTVVADVAPLFRTLWTVGQDAVDVNAALSSVELLVLEKMLGVDEGPRLSPAELTMLSDQALDRYRDDVAVRRSVQDDFTLAQDSYHDDDAAMTLPQPWVRVRSESGPDGGYAVVYRKPGPPASYVVAFRGTQPTTVQDLSEDAENAAGLPTQQGAWAVQVAKKYAQPPYDASFTGHSLGGSLAAIASLATGRPATTFNAAGVGDGNYALAQKARGAAGPAETKIVNYHTPDDSITDGQKALGLRPASGAQVTVTGKVHGLDSFVKFQTHDTSDFDLKGPVKAG